MHCHQEALFLVAVCYGIWLAAEILSNRISLFASMSLNVKQL
jgi:hypothetical protein